MSQTTKMPAAVFAGDSFAVSFDGGERSAGTGWQMHLRLVASTPGNPAFTLDGATGANGQDHLVSASSSITAEWTPDTYSWVRWANGPGGETTTLDSGTLVVRPNPRAIVSGEFDARSAARRALDDARTAFYAFDPARKRYKIGTREMEFNTAADILVKIRALEKEVEREEILAGTAARPARRIYTRL